MAKKRTSAHISIEKRILGSALKTARINAGLTQEDVAREFQITPLTAARHENGEGGVRIPEIEKYISLYGLSGTPEADQLYTLVGMGRRNSWWRPYLKETSQPQADIAALESLSDKIQYYNPMPICGLLQTQKYIREMFGSEKERIASLGLDFESQIEFRMKRQEILLEEDGPDIEIVMAESAFAFPVGDEEVMREQVEFVLHLIQDRGVDIRILHHEAGYVAQMDRSLIVSTYGQESPRLAVYLEGAPYGELISDVSIAERYKKRFDLIQSKSLDPEASADRIRKYLP